MGQSCLPHKFFESQVMLSNQDDHRHFTWFTICFAFEQIESILMNTQKQSRFECKSFSKHWKNTMSLKLMKHMVDTSIFGLIHLYAITSTMKRLMFWGYRRHLYTPFAWMCKSICKVMRNESNEMNLNETNEKLLLWCAHVTRWCGGRTVLRNKNSDQRNVPKRLRRNCTCNLHA